MPLLEFVDTHAHLMDEQFDSDREEVLARAAAAGVSRIVEIAASLEDWAKVLAFSRAHPDRVRCALGLHPYEADRCTDEVLKDLARQAALPEVVAIGEIGLDYARCPVPAPIQKETLRRILEASRAWGKPLVIHCREAYADLREILGPMNLRGVIHCFSGNVEDALFLVKAGFMLGADGPVTYPKNSVLREAFRAAGPANTLLETDCPYLPPQSSRGKRNEPKAVMEIAAQLAKVWGFSLDAAAHATTENARLLFGL